MPPSLEIRLCKRCEKQGRTTPVPPGRVLCDACIKAEQAEYTEDIKHTPHHPSPPKPPSEPKDPFCSNCGYALSPFDLECPHCKELEALPPHRPTRAIISSDALYWRISIAIVALVIILILAYFIASQYVNPPRRQYASTPAPSTYVMPTAPTRTTRRPTYSTPMVHQFRWYTVAKFSGSSSRNTHTFTVGNRWGIVWKTASPDGHGIFSIRLREPGEQFGDLIVIVTHASVEESYQYEPGTYYLEIKTTQPYAITIRDFH